MSMTREEAIGALVACRMVLDFHQIDAPEYTEAMKMAIRALRPVSREQVEKVWPGCEACKDTSLAIGEVQFYGPFEGTIDISGNMQYCPNCGRPITPTAQKRQLERLEVLKDAGD